VTDGLRDDVKNIDIVNDEIKLNYTVERNTKKQTK